MREINRREFLKAAGAGAGLAALARLAPAAEAGPAAKRPNFLFIICDDQRAGMIHALGNDLVQTPNLDRLVRGGFAFTGAHLMGSANTGAVCIPGRAMILSGRTLFRAPNNLEGLPLWPEVLRRQGYNTFASGKWHNGEPSFARCFSGGGTIFFGGVYGNQFRPTYKDFSPDGDYKKQPVKTADKFSTELFTDTLVDFISRRPASPFVAYLAFTSPHDPRTPPEPYASMYDPAKMPLPKNYLPQHPFDNGEMAVRDEKLAPWPRTPEVVRRHLCDYYGMVSCHDAQVGRVLKALEDTGQIDNTIIVFTADHGLALGQHGLFGKQNVYEHSVSIPLVLCGPGIPKGKSDALVYGFDVCPTILELAGAPVPETVEGKSLVPLMAGRQVKLRDSAFFAYQKWQRAVRDDRWKLIRYPQVDKTQLFDLQNDPWETTDLAAAPQHAAKVKEMTALLVKWQGELGDTLPLTVADPKNPDWSPPGGNGGGGKAAGAGGGKKGKQQKANP